MTPMLPVLAVAALTDHAGGSVAGLLVAGRRSRVLHVLVDTGRSLTPTGRIKRAARPVCNRRPRALRVAPVDGRPLCQRCAAPVRALYGPAALATAATWVTPTDLALTLLTARDLPTVNAARGLLIESGHTGKAITIGTRPPVRLTQLVGQARDRFTLGAWPRNADEREFISLVQRAPLGRSRPTIRRVS